MSARLSGLRAGEGPPDCRLHAGERQRKGGEEDRDERAAARQSSPVTLSSAPRGRKGHEWGGAARAGVPEDSGRRPVPPPRSALLQDSLHDLLLVRQPIYREDVQPAEDHNAEGTGSHGQPGPRELPRQDGHGPSGCVSPGPPAGAHRSPGVPGWGLGARAGASAPG